MDINYFIDYKKSHMHELNYPYTRIFDGVIREGIERKDLDQGLELSAVRDLFFGGLEYGARTLLGRKNTGEITDYVEKIVEPLWTNMHRAGKPAPPKATDLDQRIEAACLRLEQAAARLERDAVKNLV